MKKPLFILSILSVILIIFSCVPPDPAAVYGWNTNTPGSTITGPRILHRIDSANITQNEYISTTAGVLQQVKFHSTNNKMDVFYNSSNKVSKMLMEDGPMIVDLNLNYDASGKVISAVMNGKLNNNILNEAHYTLLYNSAGKVIRVDKKSKNPTFSSDFTHYGVVTLSWIGDNLVKATENNTGVIHPGGTLEPLDPNGYMTYKFEDYDNKVNPYSTLPKEFNLGMGIIGAAAFFQCSYNNHLKVQIEPFFNLPPIISYGSYVYDSQNYPISDPQGVVEFVYKPIQ